MIKGPLPSRQPGCGIRGGGYAYALRSLAQSSAYSFGSAAASCALHRNTKIRAGWRAGQQLHGLRTSRRRSRDEMLTPVRFACRGKAPASRPVRRNTGRVARKETAARSVNPYRAHCVSGLLASGGQWHTEHIASCPMRHNTGGVARQTAAARPACKPPPIPRRDSDPGPVCLPWGKMRGARFCAVAFLSGVPIPHPVCTLHAFPHGRQIRRRRSLRAIFIPRWPSSGTKSAIRRRRGRRSAQRNHIPIIHKLFVKCKFNE